MAVSQYFRNEHTSLETGKRARPLTRTCIDCPADIPAAGGKKRCSSCSDREHERRVCARHERERKAKLVAARPARHSWGLPTRFAKKTERQCVTCGLVKTTYHDVDSNGREYCWIAWFRGLDQIESKNTPACEVVA